MIFRLWIQSDIIGEWTDSQEAHLAVLEFLDHHPDEAKLANFGAFRVTSQGTKPVFAFFGSEEIKEHIYDAEHI